MKVRSILLIITSILISFNALQGQDSKASKADVKEQKAYEKQKKIDERELAREQNMKITSTMIRLQRFVLEADYLSNKYGNKIPVSPTINFIMVDSLDATMQVGSAYSIGYNGVGGETVNGRVTKYEYGFVGKKKDSYSISLNLMSGAGIYDIHLQVTADGHADATIRGNWSGQLNYYGKLVPLGESKVYKGMSRY
jgi:hypothetical protein